VDVDPGVGRHLGEARGQPRRPAVLQREDEPALDELDRDLDQPLARERVADLHRRALVRIGLPQLGAREHRCAADPVSPGGRAVDDDMGADRGRLRAGETLDGQQADAHRVHEAVRGVRVVERDLAADVRHADAVPVVGDPADGAGEVVVVDAEAQPVQEGDGARAHRGDVTEDPTDTGRCALERLDRGGVIVALDLERDREPVPEVEHAGVLAGALQHA
jgi:hypothetical protein